MFKIERCTDMYFFQTEPDLNDYSTVPNYSPEPGAKVQDTPYQSTERTNSGSPTAENSGKSS